MLLNNRRTPLYLRSTQELHDTFWSEVEPKLPLLRDIIAEHFKSSCSDLEFFDEGSYARIYRATVSDGIALAVRIILPIRDNVKTRAEVATMDSLRGEHSASLPLCYPLIARQVRTSLPVPRVYLYCSTRQNPVGAEWIIMEYLQGIPFANCFESLTVEQKKKTALDVIEIMNTLYNITSTHAGSLLRDHSLRQDQCATHYGDEPHIQPFSESCTSSGQFSVGPANIFEIMDSLEIIPPSECGPCDTERAFLELVAYAGIPSTPPLLNTFRRAPFDALFKIYDVVRPLYSSLFRRALGVEESNLFRFVHGDLSVANILLDPTTGKVTGVIDWEVSGFVPAWLAASAGGWFDDDCNRFIMNRLQDAPDGYDEDTTEDTELRRYFREELGKRNVELLHHLDHGVELRALWNNFADVNPSILWLRRYRDIEWDTNDRGPFPLDFEDLDREQLFRWLRYGRRLSFLSVFY